MENSPTKPAAVYIVFAAIEEEVRRAQDLHPFWPVEPMPQMAIIQEEIGEAAKEVVDITFGKHSDISKLKTELIQSAATIVRMLTLIETNPTYGKGLTRPTQKVDKRIPQQLEL